MSHETVPVIDLSEYKSLPDTLSAKIVEACSAWGFMVLTGHGIPEQDIEHMFELHKEFHGQPLSVKSECVVNEHQIGYDAKKSRIAVNECMVFGGCKGEIRQGINVPSWWDAQKRVDVEDFKGKVHALGLKLLELFATSFNLPVNYFSSAHDDEKVPGSVLRMLHYPVLSERPDETFPRLRSHTDWGSLTFLWTQSPGLEVETPSKHWVAVPVIRGSVIVNVGDAMSLWSGKTLKSTLHRISFDNLPIDRDRWSMAYFLNANKDAKLEILTRNARGDLVQSTRDSPVLTAGEYHQARLYLSQKEDAKNNWMKKAELQDVVVDKYIRAVESLGVANGSGLESPSFGSSIQGVSKSKSIST